jgi:eukaryotic-like serine/threonine-protein kinase
MMADDGDPSQPRRERTSASMIGRKLAHYEIREKIGEGGMGVVWRAADTTLGRDVAIKLLPEVFEQSADRLARFEREAKVLASLNHAGIAAVYGLHAADGARFLAMEYVPGDDLAVRLARGAIPVDEALEIAMRIAEAVEAAHEQGVVHRDLKPANVKVTPDGRVKVLDFGLAKALSADGLSALGGGSSFLPTVTSPATMPGVVLGTAAYMSPEQARGKPVDRRADIWAFGCLLYEMLTARRAFEGETVSDTLAAVLRAEPDYAALPAETPRRVRDLIERCLRKDASRRLRDIGDARVTLAEAIDAARTGKIDAPAGEESEAAVTAARAEAATARAEAARAGADAQAARTAETSARDEAGRARARARIAWTVASLALVAAVALYVVSRGRARGGPARTLSAAIVPPAGMRLALDGPHAGSVSLSPDGERLTFMAEDSIGNGTLCVQNLRDGSQHVIEGADWATYPFWSPDGRFLAFEHHGKLTVASVDGGPLVTLCDADDSRGGTWNADGVILFAPDWRESIFRVASEGGTPERVTTLDTARGETTHRWPFFLPDGDHFLYLVGVHGTDATSGENAIYIGSLGGDTPRLLLRARSQAIYASGHLLYLRGRDLVAHPFDAKSLELRGEPVILASGVRTEKGFFQGVFAAAADGGILAYVQGSEFTRSRLTWYDGEGRALGTLGAPDDYYDVRFSPDGRSVVMDIGDPSDLWVHDLGRNTRTRLTFGQMSEEGAVWSPDGRTLVFATDALGPEKSLLMTIAANAGGAPETLGTPAPNVHATDWDAHSNAVIYQRSEPHGPNQIWALPMSGDRTPQPLVTGENSQLSGVVSPDGRWIAYNSRARGLDAVFVARMPDAAERWQVSEGRGAEPHWRGDGKELYYVRDRFIMAVAIETEPAFRAAPARPLFSSDIRWTSVPHYDVTADGKRFLVNVNETSAEPIRLVAGWPERLRAR